MKRFILQIIALSIFFIANAIQPLVRNFTRETYKSGAQNWAIGQQEFNTMYFANNAGLLEFDGRNWSTYPISNITNVRSLLCADNGKIFAGAFNEFGYYQPVKSGKLEYHSLIEKAGKEFNSLNEIWNILKSEDNIYFQANKSIIRYDGKKLKIFPFNYKIEASAIVHNILFVAGSQKGLYMLNGDLFVRIPGSDLLLNKKVCSILPYNENKILIVTSFDGVFVFDGNTIEPFNTGIDDFLKNNQVFCATTNNRQLVFGTVQRGIAVLNIADGSVIYVNTFSGLQNNTVLSVAFDNKQNLWLGLDKGIDYVMLNSPIMNMFGTNNLYGSGYTSLLKDNILYFGTNQGLYTTAYPFINSPSPLQLELVKGMEGQVWCLDEIDNTLFCGNDQGAFIIHNKKPEQIAGIQGTWSFKRLRKYPDLILGCSYQGLFILKKQGESWVFSHFIKGKFAESSPMFEEDEDGNVWFSHWQKGMFRLHFNDRMDSITKVDLFDVSKGFPTNRNNTLYRIGNKIVFSSEYGFYTYNNKKDKVEPFNTLNNLFGTPPNSIRLYESKNKDIWCVSGSFVGVAKIQNDKSYKLDSLTYQILQPKIIIGFENFNFIDKYNLILSTEEGFSWIDIRKENKIKSNYKIYIRNVTVTNDKSSLNKGFTNIINADTIFRFPHTQNSLRFEYVAPEYRADDLVEYSYMLENYDESWSDFSPSNIKEYTQLPKGEYTFKVRAKDKLESKMAECTYRFTILPAWYESNLAFIFYGLLIISLIIGIILLINHRSKKGAKDMEKRKELELSEQKKHFEAETSEKKKEIKELKNQQLQYELRHKSQELASSTMNLIRKNEILLDIMDNISKVSTELNSHENNKSVLNRLSRMERNIKENIENDNNWKKFEENFDLVYENYLKRLGEMYPQLNTSDKKLCAYLKMDLSSKDIAPLLNMSVRSVETNRYRLRKKLELERDVNLGEFLQRF